MDELMDELKPCPFCGHEPEVGGSENVGGRGPYWYVECRQCGASVFGSEYIDKAIENWNRRADHGVQLQAHGA